MCTDNTTLEHRLSWLLCVLQMPAVVISIFSLSGHVLKFHAQFPTDQAMAIAERVLKCGVLFCGCHHKDVASAAVTYMKLTLYSITQAPKECEPLIRCIEINGGELVQNLIGRFRFLHVSLPLDFLSDLILILFVCVLNCVFSY